MYVLTTGAIKNAGDYLIHERCRALIERFAQPHAIEVVPRWQPMDDRLETINRARALVLCGGPAYQRDFHPGCVPFVQPLDRIAPPIVPMAVGLGSGVPADAIDSFTFDPPSLEALRWIHQRIDHSSARDVLTEQVLRRHGIDNVVTTGCAAWYHLDHVDRDFVAPGTIRRVGVSNPAHLNFDQAINLLKLLRKRFRRATRYLVFHRGFVQQPLRGSPTNRAVTLANYRLAARAAVTGFHIVNAAGAQRHRGIYDHCDLHIGYRVHAHLDFLSRRKPSILLQEDIRGVGQSRTLGTRDVDAKAADALAQIESIIDHHENNQYSDFGAVVDQMRERFALMQAFVKTL